MAGFKQHISGGIIYSVGAVFIGLATTGLSMVQSLVVLILGTLSSVLPDMDSNTSKPVSFLFGALGVIVPILALQFLFNNNMKTENLLCFIVLFYLFIQYVVAGIFFSFTEHRGIIHSIPVGIICGEIVFILFQDSGLKVRALYALVSIGGFLVHLIMDEIWSIDLMGVKIKRSFGSALTFRAESKIVTLVVYIVIILLAIYSLFFQGVLRELISLNEK